MRFLPLLALLALAGCDASDTADGLRLFTDASAYAPSATASLTLLNASLSPVETHPELCGAFPQVRTGGGWGAAPPYDRLDLVCTLPVTTLHPGERITVGFSLEAVESGAGPYRFAYGVAGEQVTSNTFTIRD